MKRILQILPLLFILFFGACSEEDDKIIIEAERNSFHITYKWKSYIVREYTNRAGEDKCFCCDANCANTEIDHRETLLSMSYSFDRNTGEIVVSDIHCKVCNARYDGYGRPKNTESKGKGLTLYKSYYDTKLKAFVIIIN